ncbi:LysR family transcriptional regulator [Pengzhenrongella frigida]|uniref:LysR family transcriptional regulator n=1 Tax=Pengzhenrongella frigida TaxID=1259133 RepID=A0A4Q5MZD6_9MICO|nr:LysR family transcriptional regulator [Cellulomonas sp. HLT2-17]RYV51118.1 LysR family transcriptional regulator [Cellulomonas sp. HLT2-17]
MDPRRLRLLLELSRRGSMREVADAVGVATSTVSQQLAVLSTEAGVRLIEPAGRRVRLTPAGRRLAAHAVAILGAIEAARSDLDPAAEPAGDVRVAAFATAARRSLLPVARALLADHPRVRLHIFEHEPTEALSLLHDDVVDLSLTYDYNLAPQVLDPALVTTPLWHAGWSLAVPASGDLPTGDALAVFRHFRASDWVVNSRETTDEEVIRTVSSMAGFTPTIAHRADSLELVQDIIVAGLGVGLLPAAGPALPGVALLPLRDPAVVLRAFAVTTLGQKSWPPLALVLRLIADADRTSPPGTSATT